MSPVICTQPRACSADNITMQTDPFLTALGVGAPGAAVNHHAVYLTGELARLADECLARWPPTTKA